MKYTEFAQNIKAKYPEYNDMDDLTLAKKMVDKYPQYKDVDFGETKGDVVEGTGRAIGEIATFGQAPYLAGYGKVLGGTLYDALHGKNVLKELYKDYKSGYLGDTFKEGSEEYKQKQKKYETLHPGLNFAAESIGTLATLPAGGAVAKIPAVAKALKGAGTIKKGMLAGLGWGTSQGAGHSLSHTEGELFDPKSAAMGAGTGAVAGATIGTAIPLGIMGIKGGIGALSKGGKAIDNAIKTGYKGNTEQYAVPEGVQTKTFRKLAENPAIQKEALRGDIGMRSQEFQDKAAEKTIGFVPELFDKVAKDYEALPKDTFISFDKTNATGKLLQAVQDFKFNTKFMPNEAAEDNANKLVQKIIKAGQTKNNEYGITRENLQRAMDTVWEQAEKAYKDGDYAVSKLYKDFYGILKEARATNKQVEETSAKYHDILKVKEKLEKALQVKFEKGANHRQVATKLIQEGRNRAGMQFDEALNYAKDTLSKYADLPDVKELKTAIDLAQVSYDFRPPTADKMLNRVPTKRGMLKALYNTVFDYSPQEKAKLLAKNLQEGRISPQDVTGQFDVINAGKFSTGINRFLQNQKVYGGKYNPIAAMMRNNLGKTVNNIIDSIVPKSLKTDTTFINDLREDVIDVLNNKTIKNIDFGELSKSKLQTINKIRQANGIDLLEKNHLVIPANVVKKLIDKRILQNKMTPEEVADLLIDVFHSKDSKIAGTKYKHIQAMFKIYDKIAKVGFIGKNPANKDTVIKSVYKKEPERLFDKITKGVVLDGRGSPSSVLTKNGKVAAPRFSALQNTPSKSIIQQKSGKVNSFFRNPLILATNSRINDIFRKYYNDNNGGK